MKTENQIKRDRAANKMAILFERKVKCSRLARWAGIAQDDVMRFKTNQSTGNGNDGLRFLSEITWHILPNLIDCKDKDERIRSLTVHLPNFFDNYLYEGVKSALAEIGKAYLSSFERYISHSDDINEFMTIYSTFLALCDPYQEYEHYSEKVEEEMQNAA